MSFNVHANMYLSKEDAVVKYHKQFLITCKCRLQKPKIHFSFINILGRTNVSNPEWELI